MRIGLLSDTHGYLDPAVFDYFAECSEIWHAGDIGSTAVLESLRQAKPTRAVYGNIDGPDIRGVLEEELDWECEGVRVYMTHIGGYPGRYDAAARKQLQKRRPGVFICGHSHVLRVMHDETLELIHLNPGACGNHGWHQVRTVLRFTIEAGKLSHLEAIELGRRGRP